MFFSGRPRFGERVQQRMGIILLLAPALVVVLVLFVGGFGHGVAQSFGYLPFLEGSQVGVDAYADLWRDAEVRAGIGLTVRTALLATVLSFVLGVAGALLIRSSRRGRRLLSLIFQANLPVPHLVGALCMLLLLSQTGAVSRLATASGLTDSAAGFPEVTGDGFGWSIVAAYVWKEAPFIGVVILAALSRGVADLEDVARSLGAGRWQRFRHVVLPVIAPGAAAASILVLAFTVGAYEVPYLLGRPFPAALSVVALQRYRDIDLESRPLAMAITVLLFLTVTLLAVGYLALADRLRRISR